MVYATWTKASDLRIWADKLDSRQKLPALIRRLIHATVENPSLSQFPADEGIQRRGWDGILAVAVGNAWVPAGASAWEMGTDQNPATKAEEDYVKRTYSPGPTRIDQTTFVFVTPRKWEGKKKWQEDKRAEKKWRDVIVWDCDDLEQWLEVAPAVDAWLARILGKLPLGVRDISSYWAGLAATSNPPLTPEMFLSGRNKAVENLRHSLAGMAAAEIAVSALSLQELRDFVAALIASSGDECADATASRVLIVENRDAWSQLTSMQNRLVLIPGDQLTLDKTLIAEAVSAGHHVISQIDYTYLRSGVNIRLPRADRWELQKTMENGGFPEERAGRLAREAGGCLSILIRLASKFAGQATPAWATPEEATPLLPLVLLGAWADRNEEDRRIVERLTAEPYGNVQKLATRWINQPDAPLRLVEGNYSFVSREDSWRLLSSYFTNDLVDEFMKVAWEVLSEDDPRFEIPPNERYLAGIRKIFPKFSSQLREGIAETVALLGTRGDHTPQGAPEGATWRAAKLVRDVLEDASPKRYFSLAPVLPLLAEAAPDEFLSAVENDLAKPSPTIISLFEKDADGLFSWSPHTHLMWALHHLAWDAVYLSRIILVLAALMEVDTGGRINPRPAGVMHDIFRFWFPQTSANLDERLQALDLLTKRKPEIGFSVLLALVPQGQDTATHASKPRWREYDASQIKQITYGDIDRQVQWAGTRLIKLAGDDLPKWQALLNKFARLPKITQDATLEWLRQIDLTNLTSDQQIATWRRIRRLVQEHRFFHNAFWALPKEQVDELAKIERKFAPDDPVECSKWLFGDGGFRAFGDTETPYEQQEKMREAAQLHALREIFKAKGLDGILELASTASFPNIIGVQLATLGIVPDWNDLLPAKLLPTDASARDVAVAYAATRVSTKGTLFVDKLPLEQWVPEAVAEFALALPFEKTTWDLMRKRRPEAESIYWKRIRPYIRNISEQDLDEAMRCLLQHKRPVVALEALFSAIYNKTKPDWTVVADVVESASLEPDPAAGDANLNDHSIWQLCELIKRLQQDPSTEQNRLVKLEWWFLPLARHQDFVPKMLHNELSQNPAFFAEVIAAQFRAKDEARDESKTPDEVRRRTAEAAHDLLDSWIGIPGTRPDGSIDSTVLKTWVSEARKLCAASKRIEVCDLMIGEQVSCAPADPDGTWPCESVRDILESVPSEEILRGFDCGVANQRGTYTKSMTEGGEQERELARKYQTHADKCKVSWPRTALALRRLAQSYESQAKREDERAEARD